MPIIVVQPEQTFEDGLRPASMTFAEAQATVGGPVEAIPIVGGYVLVHEEGRIRRLPPNRGASRRAGHSLVGPAIFLSGDSIRTVLGD